MICWKKVDVKIATDNLLNYQFAFLFKLLAENLQDNYRFANVHIETSQPFAIFKEIIQYRLARASKCLKLTVANNKRLLETLENISKVLQTSDTQSVLPNDVHIPPPVGSGYWLKSGVSMY